MSEITFTKKEFEWFWIQYITIRQHKGFDTPTPNECIDWVNKIFRVSECRYSIKDNTFTLKTN